MEKDRIIEVEVIFESTNPTMEEILPFGFKTSLLNNTFLGANNQTYNLNFIDRVIGERPLTELFKKL